MRPALLLSAAALVLSACSSDVTYVLTRFERGPLLQGEVTRIDLSLTLDGKSDTASITSPAPLVFPLTRALQIVRGTGALTVEAHARAQTGNELASASGQADVESGEVAGLTLILGAVSSSDLAGSDVAAPSSDLAVEDLPIADLQPALPPPTIVVTPPAGPYYELDTYVWTVTATQTGAALPPVVYFDAPTLQPGMIPAATGPGSATLTFTPNFRQAGSYEVKVIATSTAQSGSETNQLITMSIANTVDPIGNFYDAEERSWFASTDAVPNSLPVAAIGDFNGDGFDDVVHVVRNRRIVAADLAQSYEASLRFYVVLGSALGLPLPPSDANATVPLSTQIRRVVDTRTEPATAFSPTGLELFPSLFEYVDRGLIGARLFPATTTALGNEILFLDRLHVYDEDVGYYRSQIYALPSDEPTGGALVPLLEKDIRPRSDSGMNLLAIDLDGDTRDEVVYDSTIDIGSGALQRRLLQLKGAVGPPAALIPTTMTGYDVCTNNSYPQYLGDGELLSGSGRELGIAGCAKGDAAHAIMLVDEAGVQQTIFLPPRGTNPNNGPTTPFGLCDVDGDGREDLYRLDNRSSPTVVELYLAPLPVTDTDELDVDAAKRLQLPALTSGTWQYIGCMRKASGHELWVGRGYNHEDTRYEILPITITGAGALAKGAPYSAGMFTWPGETTLRPVFNRPKGTGDFNGDGKTDVITAASGQLGRSYWNVVYGR